jgi:AcrR family transcriptional regulator
LASVVSLRAGVMVVVLAERPLPKPELPTRSARIAQIVAAARTVLAAEGPEALTMRRLGAALGIQAPSLYKHLPGKDAVEAELMVDAFVRMGEALHSAVLRAPGGEAIDALLRAYRRVGRAEPNLYRLATGRPLRRDALPPGLEEWSGQPFYLVTGDAHRARALWAYAHGMVILELEGRFPPRANVDAAWRAGAEVFQRTGTG